MATVGGVRFYDDSKATNVGAAVAAIDSLTEARVVLIAGGKGKDGSYEPLVAALRQRGRAAVLIGEAAAVIAAALAGVVEVRRASTLDAAVVQAHALAQPGDAVLLARRARASTCSRATRIAAAASCRRCSSWPRKRAARRGGRADEGRGVQGANPRGEGLLGPMDPVLAAVVIALLGFGVVMVFGASSIEATVAWHTPFYFLKRQAVFACVGLGVLIFCAHFDYRRLRRLTYLGLFGVTVLLLLSVIGFGHTGGGAARWLRLGPIHIQPSEVAKLVLILWLAHSLEKKRGR